MGASASPAANGGIGASAPLVSVVIPLYNKEREVERAIRSVLAQTVRDFEIVVVNDGSTDRGPEIVAGIADPRIRLFHQDNQGVSAARNRGIAEARSDLIAFLDADDEWKPCFLEEILRLRAKYPTASVFATNYLFCDGDGRYSAPGIRGIPSHPWDGILEDYFAIASRSDPPLWTSAVAVTKAAIGSIGGFPVGVKSGEDLLTWARLALRCQVAYSRLPVAVFWRPQRIEDRPGRHSDGQDVVGQQLRMLLLGTKGPVRMSLRKYIGRWHKSRVRNFLMSGNPRRAWPAILSATRFGGLSVKLAAYAALALFPGAISRRLLKAALAARQMVRFGHRSTVKLPGRHGKATGSP